VSPAPPARNACGTGPARRGPPRRRGAEGRRLDAVWTPHHGRSVRCRRSASCGARPRPIGSGAARLGCAGCRPEKIGEVATSGRVARHRPRPHRV